MLLVQKVVLYICQSRRHVSRVFHIHLHPCPILYFHSLSLLQDSPWQRPFNHPRRSFQPPHRAVPPVSADPPC